MSAGDTQFFSKIGLIAATVGSAVGLGNIWRFPAEAQAGGGAAFLVLYILCVLILGIPVMLAEFSLGRAGRTDAIGSFSAVSPKHKKWSCVGGLAVVTAFLIAIFYMVVAGWTLEYLFESLSGGLYSGNTANPSTEVFAAKMETYISGGWRPLIFTVLMVLINLAILLGGVTKGIERLSNILMPLLFVILLAFCIVSLTLPKAGEGLVYFFRPDFSRVTPSVILSALGQAFFSLSLGMGILLTYSSYYPPETRLVRTAGTVSFLSILVAVMMGIIIFPAVMSFGLADHGVAGTTLVFSTLPEVFVRLPLTWLWSSLFFLLLAIAALTSTVSIAEVVIRCVQDRLKLSRRAACYWVMVPILVLSSVCSLSMGMFNFLDFLTAEILLPIAAIGVCVFVGWIAPKSLLTNQLTNDGSIRSRIIGLCLFIIRYVAPALIFLVLISPLL
ncbi:MAG: sodium-dependent transporter [Muribaculaceae bacterium]|nr:sodium-dependent transporter [Muribaculaceae bacterium]